MLRIASPAVTLLVASLALFCACGSTEESAKDSCGPATCTGCCDENGTCQAGGAIEACGASGAACQACAPEAACSAGACGTKTLRVFTTRDVFSGDLQGSSGVNLGFGREMDALCTKLATNAGLEGTWQAFLPYHTTTPAIERLVGAGPWHLTGTLELAFADKEALKQAPRVPLTRDETGALIEGSPVPVWTSMNADGAYSYYACVGWSTSYDSYEGSQGDATRVTAEWRFFRKTPCNREAHLYCFES